MSSTSCILSSEFPSMDLDYFDHIKGILDENVEDLNTSEEVYEAVGEILHGVSEGSKDEDEIMEICEKLLKAMKGDLNGGSSSPQNGGGGGGSEARTLNTPIHLGEMVEQRENERNFITSLGVFQQREAASMVDQKKLERAEAKLKQKQEKRETQEKLPKHSAPVGGFEATAVQSVSKRDTKQEASRGQQDIKICTFDMSVKEKLLLQNAELTLVFGRRYGMVGRNGIGKSTLLKLISSQELRIQNGVTILHVEQEVVGDDTPALQSVLECDIVRESLLADEKSLIARSALGEDVGAQLSETYLQLQNMEADKAPSKASKILAGLGFTPEMQQRFTKEFSGGWRMRIALARALFSRPDLLLLDEPTNMLDMKAIIWLENYLQTWPSTLLVVSHDRKFLNTVATDILHFHSRHLVAYRGNYSAFLRTATERLRCQQREYEAQMQARAHAQEFIDKFRYNAKRASLVQSKIKWMEKLPELKPVEKESSVVLHFPETEYLAPPLLHLENVTFSYSSGGPSILRSVDLMASMESRICIVGDNGSGKTTLLKLLTGSLQPTGGLRHVHRNLVLGYFSQHHVDQLEMGVSSLELLAQRFPGRKSEEYRRQLGRFGVTGDLALQPVATLSGGQKSRVAFSAMAMLCPHFLVLDEPTNHLDVETVEALGNAINEFKGGVVLVSHDEELIEMVCKELWVCREGSVTSISGGFKEYRRLVEQELEAQQS